MDKRPHSPETTRRTRRRGPSFRAKLLFRLLGLLLVAAIVVGIGTTANKGWGPDSRGQRPQASAQEDASRAMLAVARSASDLAAGSGATGPGSTPASASPPAGPSAGPSLAVDAKSAQELKHAARLLRRHVELLTPGLAARIDAEPVSGPDAASRGTADDSESPGSPGGSPEHPANALPTSGPEALARVAKEVGASANTLLGAASTASSGDIASVLGAGIEQRLEAQRLAALGPDHGKAVELPPVTIEDSAGAWQEALANRLPSGACSTEATKSGSASPQATPSHPSAAGQDDAEATASEEQRAATALRNASDAAFRQAYGYQMAAVKHPGAATRNGWALSTYTAGLGHRLEDLLPEDCPPTRVAAYALPSGFNDSPIGSVAASEEQLAALLRDAAARAPQKLRMVLVSESWRASQRSFTLTGTIPDLTKTS